MQFTEISYENALPIDGYGPGFFRIGGEVIEGAMLATATGAQSWGGLEDIEALTALAGSVDVIFLGTGPEMAHPPRALREALEALGVGVEPMASPIACRTYNIVLSVGRRIALAVLPV